jgi:alkanesulfonate monooxygenase SsuD/methylene tetrahydromethanopterin reductase-like flavin-dependent oxidoreductase (luciferase family)
MSVPGPLQSSRLPITVGGQSPTVVRVAAEHAEAWNTHGRPGASADEVLTTTAEQSRRIDDLAVARSFGAIGISEFVLDWPDENGMDAFEAAAREVLPGSQPGA